jgi:ribosome biogenesis SPOUT family RNA methylase Rps3
MATFVIEHLEPRLYKWSLLEYTHISEKVCKKNLLFTNTNSKKLQKLGKTSKNSVTKLKLEKACVLDPEAPQTLTPTLARKFQYFIFGGILGDYPPKKRTSSSLTIKLSCPAFNLGKEQMSTDTAVLVVQKITQGKKLSQLQFQQGLALKVAEGEEVILPYQYLVEKGKPVVTPGLKEMLKKQKSF